MCTKAYKQQNKSKPETDIILTLCRKKTETVADYNTAMKFIKRNIIKPLPDYSINNMKIRCTKTVKHRIK